VCHATNIYKQERRSGLMFPNADNTILAWWYSIRMVVWWQLWLGKECW
jgi:hypothetical protein